MTVSGAVCGLAHIAAFAGYQTSDFRTEFNTQNSFIKECSKEHARVRRASSAKELRKSYMVKIKSNRRRDADPTWFRDTLARRLVKKEFRSDGETAHYLRVFTVLMRCWARNNVDVKGLCLKSLRVFLSFTPGFSPVVKERENHRNRFNGFSGSFARQVLCTQSTEGLATKSKPLKRFTSLLVCASPG